MMAISNSEIIFLIVFIGVVVLMFFFVGICVYFYCNPKPAEDKTRLINPGYSTFETQESSFISEYDINLVDQVKIRKEKHRIEAAEAAFVYLQLFMRSNSISFKSVQPLPSIGTRSERNWFLATDNSKINMLYVDLFKMSFNNKKKHLIDIADSMDLSITQAESLINNVLTSIKHPNLMRLVKVAPNFDKDKILCIQDFSNEGSLKDYILNTNPIDDMDAKEKKQRAQPLSNFLIKQYGKQIVAALLYLKHKRLFPMYNLHSGNVILFKNKTVCQLSGYENSFFYNDDLNLKEIKLEKLKSTYLIEDVSGLSKPRTDLEMKTIIQLLRYSYLIIEMYTGISEENQLMPQAKILKAIENFSEPQDAKEILKFLNFLLFNKMGLDETNDRLKKKYVIPDLEKIVANEFFQLVKIEKFNPTDVYNDPVNLEFLDYLTGRTELKTKPSKSRRKSSVAAPSSKVKNEIKHEIIEENESEVVALSYSNQKLNNVSINFTSNRKSQAPLSPPPPPPPGPAPPLPPPPPPAPFLDLSKSSSLPKPTADISVLLGSIKKGAKLKKTVTNDRSKPLI